MNLFDEFFGEVIAKRLFRLEKDTALADIAPWQFAAGKSAGHVAVALVGEELGCTPIGCVTGPAKVHLLPRPAVARHLGIGAEVEDLENLAVHGRSREC